MTPAAVANAVLPYVPPSRDIIRKALGIAPTGPEQAAVIDSDGRFIIVSGGEQVGKSWLAAWWLAERLYELNRPGIFWLVGRKYESSFKEFDYLVDFFKRLGSWKWSSQTDPSKPRRIILQDGTIIRSISAYDAMNITAERPDGILACEASQLTHESYLKLRARSAASGGWLMMTGTFEPGIRWYPKLFDSWRLGRGENRAYHLPSWTNSVVYPGGRYDPEIMKIEEEFPEEFFLERIAGIQRKDKSLVFGDDIDIDLHVQDIDYIPGLPVHIMVDPGFSQGVHSVLFAQMPPDQPIRVFEEIYTHLSTEDVIEISQGKECWADKGGRSAIDIAGTKWLNSTAPPSEIWQKRTGLTLEARAVKIADGTDRLKMFLKMDPRHNQPKIVFSPRCAGLLSEFGICESPITGVMDAYSWVMKDGLRSGVAPKNRANHSVKALIYWLVVMFGYTRTAADQDKVRMKSWRSR